MHTNLFSNCPICQSTDFTLVEKVKDHSVSKEYFDVVECHNCLLRFTINAPCQSAIAPYYKSEDYISHTNTTKGLINYLYQLVRKFTLGQKRKLVQQQTNKITGSILDLGSGTGAFVHEMKSTGWQVSGLEPDADARKVAYESFGVNLSDTSSFYQLQPSSFDAITMWHVLEHVHDLQAYIAQLKKLLKPDGKLIIAVPNYTAADASHYKSFWAAYDVPRHLYHFSPNSIVELMKKHDLKVHAYKPMWFDSFYIAMLSSKYKNGQLNIVGAFFQGLQSNIKALFDVKKCSSVIYVIGS
jgi:2-polyprenyl-3-methyl-5-hydroxy-6-metoxy-1,4-benzoquinol methylase